MEKLPGFIDMALTPKEREEEKMDSPETQPIYPYGLAISLTDEEIEKLGLDTDCDIGDMVHMECLAKVTSVSKYDSMAGSNCRVELQIIAIADDEEEKEEPKPMGRVKSPYQ